MAKSIFLVDDQRELHELIQRPYEQELDLQDLLARYPELLTADMDERPAWILIEREAGVPAKSESGSGWSLDHLFLGADAISTLVEVKRGSDTRTRREVVGQLLDYAASAVAHWPDGKIRAWYEAKCEKEKRDPEQEILELLEDDDQDYETFWSRVDTNLRAGRIRLLFVSDRIPDELRRIVEFLNLQMRPAEVLAVEVPRYVGETMKTVAPRLVGSTAQAEASKRPAAPKKIGKEDFFEALRPGWDEGEIDWASKLLQELASRNWVIQYDRAGKGVRAKAARSENQTSTIFLLHQKKFVRFFLKRFKGVLQSEALKTTVVERLGDIRGSEFAPDAINRLPSVELGSVMCPEGRAKLLKILDEIEGRIHQAG